MIIRREKTNKSKYYLVKKVSVHWITERWIFSTFLAFFPVF